MNRTDKIPCCFHSTRPIEAEPETRIQGKYQEMTEEVRKGFFLKKPPFFFFFFFGHSTRDFSPPTRDETHAPPAVEAQSLNHWTTKEVPRKGFFFKSQIGCIHEKVTLQATGAQFLDPWGNF